MTNALNVNSQSLNTRHHDCIVLLYTEVLHYVNSFLFTFPWISMNIVITSLQRAVGEILRGFQFDLFAGANVAFEIICVGLTTLFIVFCCIPVLHESMRAIVRPWAVYHVENGLYWVALLQHYRKPFLTTLMEHSSHSVSVGFYVSTALWCIFYV